MKKYFILLAGVLASLSLSSCTCSAAKIRISPETVLLDVRTQKEYNARHIPGSILIPHTELSKQITAKIPGKSTPVILFCRSGRRSAIAAKELKKLGYTNVQDLGGLEDAAKKLGRKIRKN